VVINISVFGSCGWPASGHKKAGGFSRGLFGVGQFNAGE